MLYSRLKVEMDKFNVIRPNINGLSFGMLNWGDIALPIEVDYLNYEKQVGTSSDENEIFYRDLLSYMQYSSQSLLAYRVSPRTNSGVFDSSNVLTSTIGVTHAHLFLSGEIKTIDTSTETLITNTTSIGARGGFAIVNYNDDLYLTGGTDGSSYFDDVWKSTDNGSTWSLISTGAFSTVSGHQMIVFDNKMFIIGGTINGAMDQPFVYSSTDGVSWTNLGALPHGGVSNFSSTVFNNKIWISGGYSYSLGGISVNIVLSSPDGITWTAEAVLPYATYYHGMVAFESKLWLIGGNLSDAIYSSDGLTWTYETSLPDTSEDFILLNDDDKVYMIGGVYAGFPDFRIYESIDCINWTLLDTSSTAIPYRWEPRGVITSDDKVLYMGGYITIAFPPFVAYYADQWSFDVINSDNITKVWNEIYNGTDLYLKLNRQMEAKNIPTFNDFQILAVMAKYAGEYGNNIRITVASYLDDLTQLTVFNEDDNYSPNYYLSELFKNHLNINEHVMVVCIDGKIVDSFMFSLDNTDIRYIDNIECEYLDFYVNPNYTKAISTDSTIIKSHKALPNNTYISLTLGNSGFYQISESDYERDLALLIDRYFVDFRVMFTSGDNLNIYDYARNVVDNRSDAMLIISTHEKLYRTSIYGFDSYGLSAGGSTSSLSFNPIDLYSTIDSKNVSFFYNFKKIDIDGEIKNHSVAGDIAGNIVQSIIDMRFKEIGFFNFGNDILSINDFSYDEINYLNLYYVNCLKRYSQLYKIEGDYVLKNISYGFNYQMIKLYVIASYLSWSNDRLFENINNNLDGELKKYIANVNTMISNYVSNFESFARIDTDDFRITLEIGFKINDVIEGVLILLRETTNI